MVRNSVSRFAFTMIELIFAIVIISIAVMSLPVMARITSKGIESNILQEAIFAASAELMSATSGFWDERSMEDEAFSHLSRVIDITGNCDADRLKPGHIAQPYHRRCLNNNSITGLNSTLDAGIFSLNDASHASQSIFINTTAEGTRATGYKETYNSIVSVAHLDETGAADDDIKKITVSVSNSDGTITILNTYSANVGEIDYYKRRF